MRLTQRMGGRIFGPMVERLGFIERVELAQHVARPQLAFDDLAAAATRQQLGAEALVGSIGHIPVGLEALHVADVEMRNPITLCHGAPCYRVAPAISSTIASAAAFGSGASRIGRPTTRWSAPAAI